MKGKIEKQEFSRHHFWVVVICLVVVGIVTVQRVFHNEGLSTDMVALVGFFMLVASGVLDAVGINVKNSIKYFKR